jgi:hypothetical protein
MRVPVSYLGDDTRAEGPRHMAASARHGTSPVTGYLLRLTGGEWRTCQRSRHPDYPPRGAVGPSCYGYGGERGRSRTSLCSAAPAPPCASGFSPPIDYRGFAPCFRTIHNEGGRWPPSLWIWRRERDSNPRYAIHVYTLSRRAPSTTRTSLRIFQTATFACYCSCSYTTSAGRTRESKPEPFDIQTELLERGMAPGHHGAATPGCTRGNKPVKLNQNFPAGRGHAGTDILRRQPWS